MNEFMNRTKSKSDVDSVLCAIYPTSHVIMACHTPRVHPDEPSFVVDLTWPGGIFYLANIIRPKI